MPACFVIPTAIPLSNIFPIHAPTLEGLLISRVCCAALTADCATLAAADITPLSPASIPRARPALNMLPVSCPAFPKPFAASFAAAITTVTAVRIVPVPDLTASASAFAKFVPSVFALSGIFAFASPVMAASAADLAAAFTAAPPDDIELVRPCMACMPAAE